MAPRRPGQQPPQPPGIPSPEEFADAFNQPQGERPFIGDVPEDYRAPRTRRLPPSNLSDMYPGMSGPEGAAPRYREGDEWLGGKMDPHEIAALQDSLRRIGYLGDNYVHGRWDSATRGAFWELLAYANWRGLTHERALNELLTHGEYLIDPEDEEGSQYPPLITEVSSRDDLRRIMRRSIIDMTGEGWTQDKIDSLIDAYQSGERERQASLHVMQYGTEDEWDPLGGSMQQGMGGEIEAMTTPEGFIEARINEEDPLAIPAHEMLGFAQEALSILTSPSWGGFGTSR